jgi:adenylylsulfate kinase-like enzyme
MILDSVKRAGPPPLIWITGMPGSGKTTLANDLVSSLRVKGQHCIQLDGDELRHILNKEDLNSDYSPESRLDLALLYSRLAVSLNSQGFIVVVSTVSLFWRVHKWNRLNIKNYFEVFLDVDSTLLETVPRSRLYKTALGTHFSPEFPVNPDLVLKAKNLIDRATWLSILEDSLPGKVL